MSVKVVFDGYIYPYPKLANSAEVEGGTLRECLEHFVRVYPSACKILFTKGREIAEGYIVVINNEVLCQSNHLEAIIEDGSVIRIMAILDGG